jgi:hypothetical protein
MAELTWLDVVVATNEVAKKHNEPASMWFDWAGVLEQSKDISKWKDRYDGPSIDNWEVPIIIRAEINEELAKKQGAKPEEKKPKEIKVPPAGDLIKLDVPYVSQKGAGASSHLADCGPSCLSMIINAAPILKEKRTVDKLYELHLKKMGKQDYTSWTDMKKICLLEKLDPERKNNGSRTEALDDLRNLIRAGHPFVILVKYSFWKQAASANGFGGSHFVLVTGFDKKHVYVHDPLFREGRPNPGEFFPLSINTFLDGWGGFPSPKVNPNFSRLATQKVVSRLSA